jgi:hypothetical protein
LHLPPLLVFRPGVLGGYQDTRKISFRLSPVGSEADERIAGEFLKNPVRMENGHMPLPCGPGFGFELNHRALETRPPVGEEGTR